jgi:hypothetical protein
MDIFLMRRRRGGGVVKKFLVFMGNEKTKTNEKRHLGRRGRGQTSP